LILVCIAFCFSYLHFDFFFFSLLEFDFEYFSQAVGSIKLLYFSLVCKTFIEFNLNDEEYKQQKINELSFLSTMLFVEYLPNQLNYLVAI
jgi:hypothetical protein